MTRTEQPRALYNENDPYAAQWLRNLVARGHIAPGDVAECSIVDLCPADLAGYTQVHFFAGIGIWSAALRDAGIPDSEPVWTASCPCQPFSGAGKGAGFDDERHLWPFLHYFVAECRPVRILGEQVASKDGLAWLDLVQSDLEGTGYACAAVDICSAGVGAPHIRQRLYWNAERMADAADTGQQRRRTGEASNGRNAPRVEPQRLRYADELADAKSTECERVRIESNRLPCGPTDASSSRILGDAERARLQGLAGHGDHRDEPGRLDQGPHGHAAAAGGACGMADSNGGQPCHADLQRGGQHGLRSQDGVSGRRGHCGIGHNGGPALERPGPVNGFWRDSDWLYCRDGKWRPVESGTFPLAHGDPSRVGRLRAYGNAINQVQARIFIEAVYDCRP